MLDLQGCFAFAMLTVIAASPVAGQATTAPQTLPAPPALVNYLSTAACQEKLLPIEPAGFFAVGRRYIHPPRVEWQAVTGTARYEVLVTQGGAVLGTTSAPASPVFARTGWEKIRPGKAALVIQAFDASGKRIAISRLLPFHVAPNFDPAAAAKPRRSSREAAIAAFNALTAYKLPVPATVTAPASGTASASAPASAPTSRPASAPAASPAVPIPDAVLSCAVTTDGASPYSFPALHDWAHADMVRSLLRIADEPLKARLVAYARGIGEHLLLSRMPAQGCIYGNMIRGCVDRQGRPALWRAVEDPAMQEKMSCLVEPAMCGYAGEALVKLFEATGEARFLDAAVAMADAHVRTQLPDGSWPARVDGRSGEILGGYSSSVGAVASFLNRLAPHRPDPRWGPAEARARAWMMANPMKTCGWVTCSDDGGSPPTAGNPYAGSLSSWDLFGFVRYLCRVHGSMPAVVDSISEQLAWNDDQFVFFASDPLLASEPFYPVCAEQMMPGNPLGAGSRWLPTDLHTANWGRALLDAHRLTKDPRLLAMARAAGDALTNYQLDDGRTMTWLCDRSLGLSTHVPGLPAAQTFQPAGWALAASLWAELAAMGQ